MTVILLAPAEEDLEDAFNYYNAARPGLGDEFIVEFRRAVDRIIQFPHAWQRMDETYRRCRLHRFPYGVIYRVEQQTQQIIVQAVMHLSRRPDSWRDRVQ